MKRTMNTSLFIMSMLAIAATAAVQSGCTGSDRDTRTGSAGAPGPNSVQQQKQSAFSVSTTEVRERRLEEYIKINGDVKAATSVSVYPEVAGTVSRITVRVGDYVVKDQTVAMVDPSRPGSVYKESPVSATITGTVTEVHVDPGQKISTSVPLVELGNLETLQVEARVPERFVGTVGVGTRAELTFEPYPGARFNARVVEVSPVLSASSRTLRVTLEFEDPKNLVKAGMLAGIRLTTRVREKALAVPSNSIVSRNGESVVFVLDPESPAEGIRTVAARNVRAGVTVDGMTEILQGLTAGEVVVTAGQTLLEDGAQVTVVVTGAGMQPGGKGGPA